MTERKVRNVAASIRHRLLNAAREQGRPYNEVEQYYAMERFLWRLGRSPHATRFVLKGALMLRVWGGDLARATRDIDLLGRMAPTVADVEKAIRECLVHTGPDDGVVFDPGTVRGAEIRAAAKYEGVRIRVGGSLGTSRLDLQIDVGFGDDVVPEPTLIDYPELLDAGSPRILGYAPETSIAEKLEAMVSLDIINTRVKDFFDIAALASTRSFDGGTLARAIRQTFARRGTPLPTGHPPAWTPAYYDDVAHRAQWRAFLRKIRRMDDERELGFVMASIAEFLGPVLDALVAGAAFDSTWPPGGSWKNSPDRG